MNKFDDIFSRKAKEAFDNYNADHLAEEGWNAYVSKYGRRRSRAIVFPMWARAASILVLVTAGVLFTNRLNHREADETAGQVAQETGAAKADSGTNETGTIMDGPVIANSARASGERLADAGQPGNLSGARLASAGQPGNSSVARPSDRERENAGLPAAVAAMDEEPGLLQAAFARQEVSAGVIAGASPLEIRLADEADVSMSLKPKKPLKDYPVLPRERMTTTIMTGLSGMMASVGDASPTSQGMSIGFYVEQQLSRRISVRPGLAMARHNYTMEGMSGGSSAMDYAAPELNGMDAASTSYDADIDVVSMEVPVNFVFSLRKRARSDLFISTGASTVIYLSQHLTGNFNNTYAKAKVDSYGGVYYEYMSTSVTIEREQELLSRVDLLGLANFSAGYSFPFAGTSQLLFEPFIQLPIKDLTSMNLRIRYGGLSMKIRF